MLINKDIGTTKWDHIISIIWVYFMIFPTGNIFNVSIPLILLLVMDRNNRYNSIITPLIILLIPSIVLNIGQDYMGFKPLVRAVTVIIIFFTFSSTKGNRILFPYILFAASYILLSQISFMFHIPLLYGFFDRVYDISNIMMNKYRFDVIGSSFLDVQAGSRLGGMYINPNVCASYVSVLYALGLCEIEQLKDKKKLIYLFVAIVGLSTICTGSRTSFIVFMAISLYYLYSIGYSVGKFVVLGAVLLIASTMLDIGDFRMLNVKDGMSSSFGAKMSIFGDYLLSCNNPIFFLFGGGDIAVTNVVLGDNGFEGCDCDFGNIFMAYGLIFYVAYIIFNFRVCKSLRKDYRTLFWVMLWVFSNSILISYRMCPVWFLSLGLIYRRNIVENSIIQSE